MAFRKTAAAIDLGAQNVKAVLLSVTDSGVRVERALYMDRAELEADGLEKGNVEQLARMVAARLSDQGIPTKGLALGIASADCMLRYTRIPPMPAWRLKSVIDYEVKEVAEKIGEPLASGFRPLAIAREADEEQTVLIGLAKEGSYQGLLEHLEDAGVTVAAGMPGPLALHAAHDAFGVKADADAESDDLLCLLDLGAETLSIALVLNDKLIFARSGSQGGKSFTEALAQALRLDFAQAEKLKISKGGLDDRDRGVHHDTVMPLRGAAGQVLSMIQSTLRIAASQTGAKLPPVTRVVASGGAMRLRGLLPFLAQGLGRPVELLAPRGLEVRPEIPPPAGKALAERPADFAVAFGLAAALLRSGGADPLRAPLTILPAKYLKRREFRDRTLFLYVAGGLLAAFLASRLGYALVSNARANRVLGELQTTRTELGRLQGELTTTRAEADKRKTRLNRVLREAEQTAFQAFVLDLLGRALRPEFQLERIQLAAEEADDEVSYDYNLRIFGRVNNEKRRGLEWIHELQTALQAEDRIGSARVEASNPDGVWYTFELAVRPNYVSY